MTITTTKPTGRPSWPVLLLSGIEGAGKSYAIAEASASPLVDGALWVNYGEKRPDEYAALPGADFGIVEHDGTYEALLATLTEIATLEQGDRPKLLVLDSASKLWETIGAHVQQVANDQATARAEARGRSPLLPADVSPELWTVARDMWLKVILTLQAYPGPVIITARMEDQSVVDDAGNLISSKLRTQTQKSLGFDADAIVDMPARGRAILRKVRSVRIPLTEPEEWPDFTVDALWRRLGLGEGAGTRVYDHAADVPAPAAAAPAAPRNWIADIRACTDVKSADRLIAAAQAERRPAETIMAMQVHRETLAKLDGALG